MATTDFAQLLRSRRREAGLSQEALAERAGISIDAIGMYERGLQSTPRRDTVALLVDALRLGGEAREAFEAAANQKRAPGSPPSSGPRHNLPWQPTSFVGRHREVQELSGLLAPRRLVTVTGAGGIGKTRTSLEVALRLARVPRDGLWFVDLAPLSGEALVVNKLSSVLDVKVPEREDIFAALAGAINNREMLLILDNCEHVLTAVREVAVAILQACPHVTLLATSRERLAIAGEVTYLLPTLPIPDRSVTTAVEGRSYDAVELFAERAAGAKHDFLFSDEHVEAATDICRRLDGIALAIELAAARLPVLGLSELRTQLAQHFHVIAGGRRDLPERHRTLHAAISWSHGLLDGPERTLFRRLAIFVNGWTLEAAKAVCADATLNETSVFDALLSLVEKSLVVVDLDMATPRYAFFESTRAYALEQISPAEKAALARRHAQWMAMFADRADETYFLVPQRRWEILVLPEFENALAALEWTSGPEGDAVLGGRIASGFQGFWNYTGLALRRHVHVALERIDAEDHPGLIARLLLAQYQFLNGTARAEAMKRAIALADTIGDRRTLATSYTLLSRALAHIGQYPEAEAAGDRATTLLHAAGMQRSSQYSNLLLSRSLTFYNQLRLDEAKATLTEALALAEELGDEWLTSVCQLLLAPIEFTAGNVPRAIDLEKDALANARRVHGAPQQICSLNNLACYQIALGDLAAADANAREALTISRTSTPDELGIHAAIQHLAAIAALRGQPSHGASLIGYVNGWYERIGSVRDPADQKGYDILMESLRAQLSDDEISQATTQGAELARDSAVARALDVSQRF
jgi:predicted ATPase/transcriptional regulator with XRE-family HTH domain